MESAPLFNFFLEIIVYSLEVHFLLQPMYQKSYCTFDILTYELLNKTPKQALLEVWLEPAFSFGDKSM